MFKNKVFFCSPKFGDDIYTLPSRFHDLDEKTRHKMVIFGAPDEPRRPSPIVTCALAARHGSNAVSTPPVE
jgi:hypothetical protein